MTPEPPMRYYVVLLPNRRYEVWHVDDESCLKWLDATAGAKVMMSFAAQDEAETFKHQVERSNRQKLKNRR